MAPDDLRGNLLLAALRPQDRALLAPHMDLRESKRGDVLFEVDQDVTHIFFPIGQSVAALVIVLESGRSVETAAVGHEGAIGGVVSQGSLPAFSQAVVQVDIARAAQEAEKLDEAARQITLLASKGAHDAATSAAMM